MIVMDNKIHRIINLLVITNVNGIIMIEQQSKLRTELIMTEENGKPTSIHSVIPTPYIKSLPVIPFDNEHKCMNISIF